MGSKCESLYENEEYELNLFGFAIKDFKFESKYLNTCKNEIINKIISSFRLGVFP